jgi:hypothetical protein
VTTLELPVIVDEQGGWRDGVSDLLFGARLAMAGRRTGWVRMLLTAGGTAIGVCVLLFAASIPHVLSAHEARITASAYAMDGPAIPGVAPLQLIQGRDVYRGQAVDLTFVRATGPTAPVPPGLSRVPGPGEAVYSPALATLLASREGALLRPRFPGRQIGIIGNAGLISPRELTAWIGTGGSGFAPGTFANVYRFGDRDASSGPLPPLLWALLVVGIIVLLFPIVVFVVTCSRLSGSQRDRRLAAIRLVGATAGQARLIAAGEALVAAPVGLLLGAGLFLALRPIAERQELLGLSPFARDIVPGWPLALLIAVAVPVLAVVAALVGLRRTLIEPLGVVRDARPRGMRFWWRVVPPLAGLPLLYLLGQSEAKVSSSVALVTGVVLVLLGIPLVLPWIVQRMLRRSRSTTPALQLATGRLGTDASTAARVVAGLAVVLAGAVSFSTLLSAAQDRYAGLPELGQGAPLQVAFAGGPSAAAGSDAVAARLAAVPGVTGLIDVRRVVFEVGDTTGLAIVASCKLLLAEAHVRSCVDGQVFVGADRRVRPGSGIRFLLDSSDKAGIRFTVPRDVVPVSNEVSNSDLLMDLYLTPAAARVLPTAELPRSIDVRLDPADTDAPELVRNAVGPLTPDKYVQDPRPYVEVSEDTRTFRTIRRGLFAGAVLTLGVAGATMLVMAIEQIRERRRPLAALAAAGVPRALLTRSLVWQNAIPVALAVLLADGVGVVLGALLRPIAGEPPTVDWSSIGVLSALTVVVVAVVTALTLPSVRRATRPTMLRAE